MKFSNLLYKKKGEILFNRIIQGKLNKEKQNYKLLLKEYYLVEKHPFKRIAMLLAILVGPKFSSKIRLTALIITGKMKVVKLK